MRDIATRISNESKTAKLKELGQISLVWLQRIIMPCTNKLKRMICIRHLFITSTEHSKLIDPYIVIVN